MITLVTGGSGSGKSEFAENLILRYKSENQIYIATMYPYDKESLKRIERHRDMRRLKNFETYECFTTLKNIELPLDCVVLLDCIPNLIANEMYHEGGSKEDVINEVKCGINRLIKKSSNIVFVTNEVFSDGIDYDSEMKKYLYNLGEINKYISSIADEVIEVVYSIPLYLKGGNQSVGIF